MEHVLLTLEGVTKTQGSLALLSDISLTLCAGKVCGVFGPKGSGKSLLLRLIAGLVSPKSGRIGILGHAPNSANARAAIAYLPDVASLPSHMTVSELSSFYAAMFADFDKAKADARITELKVKTDKRVGDMSRSTKEVIQLIFTLSRHARLYLLDMPLVGTSAAKELAFRLIREAVREDSAVLFTAETPEETEDLLDAFLILSEGRIALSGDTAAFRLENGATLTEKYREVVSC